MKQNRITVTVGLVALAALSACVDGPFETGRVPSELMVDPPTILATQGDALEVAVTVLDQHGEPFQQPPRFGAPVWTVQNPNIARPEGSVLTALQSGQTLATVEMAGLRESTSLRVNPAQLLLEVDRAYLTQGSQRHDGSIPLVSGRDAYLRVFLRGDVISFFGPDIRVVLYRDGAVRDTLVVSPGGPTIPTSVNEAMLPGSWTIRIPGERIRPGLAFHVEVDPGGVVPAAPGSHAVWPPDGEPVDVAVRAVPRFEARLVPVRIEATGRTGAVNDANALRYLDLLLRVFPIAEFDVDVRSAYTTNHRAVTTADWIGILQEIALLRIAEGSPRYYYGVVEREGGPSGIGYVGWPAAAGWDDLTTAMEDFTPRASATYAHELGHNFGRYHAPCGNPAGIDQGYPYPGGVSGVYGFDLFESVPRSAQLPDLMGYCWPRWVSDYTYRAVMDYREQWAAQEAAAGRADRDGAEPTLLVWGAITPDGLTLEPAFELATRPHLPEGRGPHLIEGLDAAGDPLFRLPFAALEVAGAETGVHHFAFALPAGLARLDRLATLRLASEGRAVTRTTAERVQPLAAGPATTLIPPTADRVAGRRVELRWNAAAHPAALVRDPRSGEIIAIVRDGEATLGTDAPELDVHLSDGVRSRVHRVAVSPP